MTSEGQLTRTMLALSGQLGSFPFPTPSLSQKCDNALTLSYHNTLTLVNSLITIQMAEDNLSNLVLIQFRPAYDILAYLAFAGRPLSNTMIENVAYPSIHACPELPCLQISSTKSFVPYSNIFDYLKENQANLDAGLPSRVNSEIRSFSSLVQCELRQVVDIARYADDEHFWKVTYSQLKKTIPWPFNRLIARKLRHEVLLSLYHIPGEKQEKLNTWAVNKTRSAYQAISERLGNSDWILNTTGPTSLDCLFFGHLCEAKFEPILYQILSEFSSLEEYFLRTLQLLKRNKFFTINSMNFPGPDLDIIITSVPTAIERLSEIKSLSPPRTYQKEDAGVFTDGVFQALAFAACTILAYLSYSKILVIREQSDYEFEEEEEE